MASTVTLDGGQTGRGNQGDVFVRRGVLNLGAYATGGVAVTKGQLELPVQILDLDIQPSSGYTFEAIAVAGGGSFTVKAYYDNAAGAYAQNVPEGEVTNAANLVAITPRFEAKGR